MHLSSVASIQEWSPTNFQTLQPLEGALVALLYVALSRNVRLSSGRLLVLLAILHLALQHSRHQMLAGIVGAIVLAKPLGIALSEGQLDRSIRPLSTRLGMSGLVCLALLTGARLTHPIERANDAASPIAALAHVPADIQRTHVFNSYEFGGYLIFRQVKPFIDGRADMYGDDFMSVYLSASAPDRTAFERIVRQYDIRWTIVAAASPAVAVIEALPHWHRLYADNVAVVDVRDHE
jgi:hypothetical protein